MVNIVYKLGCMACLVICLSVTGCSMLGGKDNLASGQHEPKIDEEPDRWAMVGKEGRGNRPLEDEHDPLKPLLMSKQARDIENSLGYKTN